MKRTLATSHSPQATVLAAPAREVVALEALPQARIACEILPSILGSRIGDVASLMAAITQPSVRAALEGTMK